MSYKQNSILRHIGTNLPFTVIELDDEIIPLVHLRPYQNFEAPCLYLSTEEIDRHFYSLDEVDTLTGVLDKTSENFKIWLTQKIDPKLVEISKRNVHELNKMWRSI